MTSKQALTELFNEANRLSCEEPKYTTHELWEMCRQIEKDLEVLEILLANFLKKSIGEGTQPNTTILLDSQSYDKIRGLLENDK